MATKKVECPHVIDGSYTGKIFHERLSNTRRFYGCHPCLRESLKKKIAQEDPSLAAHLIHVTEDIEIGTDKRGFVIVAPPSLIETIDVVIEDRGCTYRMKGFRVLDQYAHPAGPITEHGSTPDSSSDNKL